MTIYKNTTSSGYWIPYSSGAKPSKINKEYKVRLVNGSETLAFYTSTGYFQHPLITHINSLVAHWFDNEYLMPVNDFSDWENIK